MSTPDYILTETYTISKSAFQDKVLDKGTFIRPIRRCWLPDHILKSDQYRWFNPFTEVYCYTPIGIVSIPKKYMRRIGA